MTTIEKRFATDFAFREKVIDLLPNFTGMDYLEANDVLAGVKYCLQHSAVFDYDDSKDSLKAFLDAFSE